MSAIYEVKKSLDESNQRKSQRNAVTIRAELLVSGGKRFIVSVNDISKSGFRIETGNYIPPKKMVYLSLPGMASLQARVAWHDRVYYGCEFTYPLHESIFEHISKQHPSLVC